MVDLSGAAIDPRATSVDLRTAIVDLRATTMDRRLPPSIPFCESYVICQCTVLIKKMNINVG
jgi:hypothetical protein